jgi:beta-galactosidase
MGGDLAFATVAVSDHAGTLVPRSGNEIQFRVDGPGTIVATDNGDPTSFEAFQSPRRRAFNGLALVVVRTRAGQPGRITLVAESEGLASATCVLGSSC